MPDLKIQNAFVVAAVLIGATVSYFSFPTKEKEAVSSPKMSTASRVDMLDPPATETSSKNQPSAMTSHIAERPTRSVSEQSQLMMVRSTDWRAFALNALKKPEEGGYFYAAYVAKLCSRDTTAIAKHAKESADSILKSSGTVSAKQLWAVERVSQICASFVSGEAAEIIKSANDFSKDGKDPLMNSVRDLTRAVAGHESAEMMKAVASALKTGDPLVLEENRLLERVMASNDKNNPDSYWFKGDVYRPAESNQFTALMFAIKTSACRHDAPCVFDDFLLTSCAIGGGDCGIDRDEYVRKQIADVGLPVSVYSQYLQIKQNMADAIEQGDAAAFVKP